MYVNLTLQDVERTPGTKVDKLEKEANDIGLRLKPRGQST